MSEIEVDIESHPSVTFISKKGPQVLAAIAANTAAFCLGNVCGWASTAVPSLADSGSFSVTIDEQSWITALPSLASIGSVYPAGYLIEKFGRQRTIIYLCLPFVMAWLVMTYSTNVLTLCLGRFVTGMCGATVCVAAPVYIGETVEPKIRGFLGAGFQLMIVTGILFSYVIGMYANWQYQCLICAFMPCICLIAMVLVPESPRFLVAKGRIPEATQALMWLRGATSFEQVEDEMEVIQHTADLNAEVMSCEILCGPGIMKPVCVAVGLMVCQQLSGIDAISNYTVNIFREAGSNIDPNVSTIIMGVVQVIATTGALPLLDRAGRKILVVITNVIMAVALGVLGLFFYLKEHDPVSISALGWVPLTCLVIYITAFSMGIGPVSWTMIGELLPGSVVGMASAVATSIAWTMSFLILRFFEDISQAFGNAGSFWFFANATVLSIVFVCICVPETKGKSLEEIQEYFNTARTSRVLLVDPKPKTP